MIELRQLIVARIRARGPGPYWMLDVYLHLIDQGASRDEATEAMSLFVDEIIAAKRKRRKHLQPVK